MSSIASNAVRNALLQLAHGCPGLARFREEMEGVQDAMRIKILALRFSIHAERMEHPCAIKIRAFFQLDSTPEEMIVRRWQRHGSRRLYDAAVRVFSAAGDVPGREPFLFDLAACNSLEEIQSSALVLADYAEEIGHHAATAIREFYGQPTEVT